MRSDAVMTFVLQKGAIRTRVQITQRFAADGMHAQQTVRGKVTGGTGAFRRARGTISGGGRVVDRASRLGPVDVRYVLTFT